MLLSAGTIAVSWEATTRRRPILCKDHTLMSFPHESIATITRAAEGIGLRLHVHDSCFSFMNKGGMILKKMLVKRPRLCTMSTTQGTDCTKGLDIGRRAQNLHGVFIPGQGHEFGPRFGSPMDEVR